MVDLFLLVGKKIFPRALAQNNDFVRQAISRYRA